MKLVHRFSLATLSAAALSLLAAGSAQAESTYGYNAAGTGPVSATARVKIEVKVPLLILLRVGASGTWGPAATAAKGTTETVSLAAAFSGGIPGGITGAALTTAGNGNSLPSGWDGTAPVITMTSTPTAGVQAWAWTNSSGGGSLNGAVTTPFTAAAGLTAAHIDVATTAGLGHPGTNTGTFTAVTFSKNLVETSDWTYSINAAGLAAMNPGTYSQVITYTATSV